ncbi:flagellar export chaperone FliS [bacterium]|nr:flagellar export chaperone FliS [bacterium]
MPPVNPYSKYIKQYQASNVNTATPEKLMILLFDAAIQFLIKAKNAIDEHDFKARSENIDGARKIIRELMRTIDLENGNDVSKMLFKLYNRMAMDLIKANVQRNTEKINSVIEDLTNIRWGFQKAIEIQSGVSTLDDVLKEQSVTQEEGTQSAEIGGEEENAG